MNMMTKGLLAATALVSLPSLAQAAPIIQNVTIAVPNTIDGVYINVVTGATSTTPGALPTYDLNPYNNGAGLTFFSATTGGIVANGSTSGTSAALDLAAGFVIGATSTFVNGQAVGTAFQTPGNHIVGFRFQNEVTGIINYGYARITTSAGTGTGLGFPATITQLVYENTGASLTVAGAATGGVPEPTTWAMMMLGFGAMGGMLRRSKAASVRVRYA